VSNPTAQPVLFEDVFSRPVQTIFDDTELSSDGGLVLLKALDSGLRLTERLGKLLPDERQATKVVHPYLDQFRQRVFCLAAGYADCNDAAKLAPDPILKECCGREALEGQDLASQPTLSRFENIFPGRTFVALAHELEDIVIARHKKRLGSRARKIVIDLDPTDDSAYGQQAFSFFNTHYHGRCFLPLLGFLSFNDEPDHYLFLARLRPGKATARRGAFPVLRRIVRKLKTAFPRAQIHVRLDGGFAAPDTFEILEDLGVEYVVGMGKNSKLKAFAEPSMERARGKQKRSGETERVYTSVRYRARSWNRSRRVVVKSEVTVLPDRDPRDNPRFVVTNMAGRAQDLYRFYGGRGDSENRIKEMKDLDLGRTSCESFLANQLRVLITATAYVLYQELRLRAKRTDLGRAQVRTLRERLVKIAARVVVSIRRIVLHFPRHSPWRETWRRIALASGAASP
jgi:hypothetical protein